MRTFAIWFSVLLLLAAAATYAGHIAERRVASALATNCIAAGDSADDCRARFGFAD